MNLSGPVLPHVDDQIAEGIAGTVHPSRADNEQPVSPHITVEPTNVRMVNADSLGELGCPPATVHSQQACRLGGPAVRQCARVLGCAVQRCGDTGLLDAGQERPHARLVLLRFRHELHDECLVGQLAFHEGVSVEHGPHDRETPAWDVRVARVPEPHHVAHVVDVVRRHYKEAARWFGRQHAERGDALVVRERMHRKLFHQALIGGVLLHGQNAVLHHRRWYICGERRGGHEMASVRRPPTIATTTPRRQRESLDLAADRLLADTCARMKGLMALGVGEHEYPDFKTVPWYHGDETNKAVEEIETRMKRLVDLERHDVRAKHEDYEHLRNLELESLIADAVPHIVYHMASSIRPHMKVSGLIVSFRGISKHYKQTLRVFREKHGFNTDDHHHDRRVTDTRRAERAREAIGGGGEAAGSDLDEEYSSELDPEEIKAESGGEGEESDEEKEGERPARRRSGKPVPDVITVAGGGVPRHERIGGGGEGSA